MNMQTVRTVCEVLGVPEYRVRNAIRDKQLKVLPLGNRQLIDLDEARALLVKPSEGTIKMAELSAAIGISQTGIRRGIREGWIPCEKVGKAFVFHLEDVEKAIRERMEKR